MANNTEGVYKRGILLGFVIGWGNINRIVSTSIYFEKPKYIVGHAVVMAYMIVFPLSGSVLLRTLLARENDARKAGKRHHWAESMTYKERELLGEKRPDFIYTL